MVLKSHWKVISILVVVIIVISSILVVLAQPIKTERQGPQVECSAVPEGFY